MQISFIFPSVPSPRLMISNHVNHECLAQSYKDEVLRMKGLSRADLMISNHVNHVFVVWNHRSVLVWKFRSVLV